MKKLLGGLLSCILGGWLLTACTSDDDLQQIPEGKGYVKLALNTNTGFQTKAVDESYYRNLENYTVDITNSEGVKVGTYTGTTIPSEMIELNNDTYSIKAYCGEDKAASTKSMYVEGIQKFDINSNQVTEVIVNCAPVCARVKVIYEGMEEYFTNWSTTFKTQALDESSFVYEKDMTDPLYLKVNKNETIFPEFSLTSKTGKVTIINNQPFTLNPNEALTITIKPTVDEGSLGITIEINNQTNDIPINIEIPSDWV